MDTVWELGGRKWWPQAQRATLSPYFSVYWLTLKQSKSTRWRKTQWEEKRVDFLPLRLDFKSNLMESPCVAARFDTDFTSAESHGSCSQIINSVWWVERGAELLSNPVILVMSYTLPATTGNPAVLKACWGLDRFPIPHRPQPSSQPEQSHKLLS